MHAHTQAALEAQLNDRTDRLSAVEEAVLELDQSLQQQQKQLKAAGQQGNEAGMEQVRHIVKDVMPLLADKSKGRLLACSQVGPSFLETSRRLHSLTPLWRPLTQ